MPTITAIDPVEAQNQKRTPPSPPHLFDSNEDGTFTYWSPHFAPPIDNAMNDESWLADRPPSDEDTMMKQGTHENFFGRPSQNTDKVKHNIINDETTVAAPPTEGTSMEDTMMQYPHNCNGREVLRPRDPTLHRELERRASISVSTALRKKQKESTLPQFNQPPKRHDIEYTQPAHGLVAEDPHKLRRFDIQMGTGSGPNNHYGNIEYRKLINANKLRYSGLSNMGRAKTKFVHELWQRIVGYGGRFMDPSAKTGGHPWEEIHDKKRIMNKISQSFREKPKTNRKKFVCAERKFHSK